MKRKERYSVRLDEVILTRGSDYVEIVYKEPDVPSTRLQIGPEVTGLSDQEIIDLFNEMLRETAKFAAEYKHVAVEVPLDSPQIKYFARGQQWCPRGGVLRCLIADEDGQLVVGIDQRVKPGGVWPDADDLRGLGHADRVCARRSVAPAAGAGGARTRSGSRVGGRVIGV